MSNIVVAHAERAHSPLGASNAERWLNCSASVNEQERYPEPPTSKAAAEGTFAHELLELRLRQELTDDPKVRLEFVRKLRAASDEMKVEVMKSAKLVLAARTALKSSKMWLETKVNMHDIDPELEGTTDITIANVHVMHVIDFKYGRGYAVEAEKNWQLLFYALGMARRLDWRFKRARLSILQPRAEHKAGGFRHWDLTADELRGYEAFFRKGVERVRKAPRFFAGEWCQWCRAKAGCKTFADKALQGVRADFPDTLSDAQIENRAAGLTNEELSKVLEKLPMLDQYIKALWGEAHRRAQAGESIPGFKTVERRARRVWKDGAGVELDAIRFGGEAFDVVLKSPKAMESVAGKDWVNDRVVKVSSGITLVPAADSRTETTRAALDFTDISNEEKGARDGEKESEEKGKKGRPKKGGRKKSKAEAFDSDLGF